MRERNIKRTEITTGLKAMLVTSGLLVGVGIIPVATYAVSNTANTVVNATIASTISITSSGTVNLGITPVTGGSQTTASDTVGVSTNNSSGYTLSLKDADATLTLVNGSNTIANSSNTYASPAILANNTWGYRVDSATIGGFGAGPTTATANQTSNSATFSGIHSTDDIIKQTTTTTSGDNTLVWYSAKADTSKPNGTYTDTVTYTATTNP